MSLDREAWQRLKEMAPEGEEADFFGELITLFVETAPPIIDELAAALAANDVAAVQNHAHRLKGMCQGMGIVELGGLAQTLEVAARSGGSFDATRAQLDLAFELAAEDLKKAG